MLLSHSGQLVDTHLLIITGIAGGEKYIYAPERIFFKIAVDKRGLYGGDEFIMKAAGHELKGLIEYMDCRVAGLHFPLAVLVDYRGYRLIAEAILPVGRDTLVYGSADGGTNIHADHPHMNARMKTAAKILNLKGLCFIPRKRIRLHSYTHSPRSSSVELG